MDATTTTNSCNFGLRSEMTIPRYVIMCRKAIPPVILFLLPLLLSAQTGKTSGFQHDRLFTGGGIGVQIGQLTLIDVSPHIGYFLTDKLAVGIGGTYQYYNVKTTYYKYSTSIWGARSFGRYYLIPEAFAHVEYEYLNYASALIDPYGYFTGNTERVGVDNVLVGGGYRQPLGGNAWLNLIILWNINESVYTLYDNPIIRMGVDLGL